MNKLIISYPNNGCRRTFENRMARWRHLKICNGVADQKDENISDFEDTGNCLLCKLCNVLMKHKSNT